MQIRILSADDVHKSLSMTDAIEGMKTAFAQLSSGSAVVPLRTRLETENPRGTILIMPAYLPETGGLATKIVSVFPENNSRNEPTIYATLLILDAQTGRAKAMMDGHALTAIRTGAASGVATDLLARKDASVVAILGSGEQARTQLEAVCTVRTIREVRIYGPVHADVLEFARQMEGKGPVPQLVRVTTNAEAAVRGAHIICAATSSSTPVLDYRWLSPGTHINGIGSYLPTMQEVDEETVKHAMVVVDSRASALTEAGDLITPLQSGVIQEAHIHAELGEIINGVKPARINSGQITFFKSVGVAVQDVVAGQTVLQTAESLKLGTMVDM